MKSFFKHFAGNQELHEQKAHECEDFYFERGRIDIKIIYLHTYQRLKNE